MKIVINITRQELESAVASSRVVTTRAFVARFVGDTSRYNKAITKAKLFIGMTITETIAPGVQVTVSKSGVVVTIEYNLIQLHDAGEALLNRVLSVSDKAIERVILSKLRDHLPAIKLIHENIGTAITLLER